MRVTPRLPVHGSYEGCPYVEMRYVRFQDYSLAAAVIFRLLEEVQFHGLDSAANDIRMKLDGAPPLGKRLIVLSLNGKVAEERILTAWNVREDAVYECVAVFTQMFQGDWGAFVQSAYAQYGLQILRLGEEAQKRPKARSLVYWDEGSGSVVLLYPNYSMGSFTVSPCGHIHLKADLFRKAREAMGVPMAQERFAVMNVKCGSGAIGCERNISQFVYQEGKEAACLFSRENEVVHKCLKGEKTTTELQRQYNSCCAICKKEDPVAGCINGCNIGLCCLTLVSFTALCFRCPICKHKIKSPVIERVMAKRSGVSELKMTQEACECSGCGELKPLDCFRQIMQIDHKCLKAVDFGTGSSMKCPYCQDYFHLRELQSLREWQSQFPSSEARLRRNVSTTGSNLQPSGSSERCECDQVIRAGKTECMCYCQSCHLKRYLLTSSRVCPKCSKSLNYSFPRAVNCSECLTLLDLQSAENPVFGVCEKGCLLCKYCVKIVNMQLICACCSSPVEGRSTPDAQIAQSRQGGLACRCGQSEGATEQLRCGHIIHRNCRSSQYSCRICGEILKAKDHRVELSTYLYQ